MLGFLEFAGVAGGGHVANTTVDDKDSGNNTSHGDDPVDEIQDHCIGVNTTACGSAVADVATTTNKGDTDGTHNDVSPHNDGEANEGMSEGFTTGGGFTRIAAREDIEITTIDNIAENEIGGDNSDVGSDIGGDGPDIGL